MILDLAARATNKTLVMIERVASGVRRVRSTRRARLILFVLITAILVLMATASPSLAACQQSVDFTGKGLNDEVTLDVSSCTENILAGLYTSSGLDSTYPPMIAGGSQSSDSINAGNGISFLVTPNSDDGGLTFKNYTIKLTSLGSVTSAGFTLYYASIIYGITDTSYQITVTNIPLALPAVTSVTPAAGTRLGGTAVTIQGNNFSGRNCGEFWRHGSYDRPHRLAEPDQSPDATRLPRCCPRHSDNTQWDVGTERRRRIHLRPCACCNAGGPYDDGHRRIGDRAVHARHRSGRPRHPELRTFRQYAAEWPDVFNCDR